MRIQTPLIALAALIAVSAPLLQGCVPVVVGGIAAGALAVDDRRTLGAQTEDKSILVKAEGRLGEKFGRQANINVTSFNRKVLLTGEVPDAAAKTEAGRIAAGVENIASVVNELQIAGASSIGARTNDAVLTAKVKGNFVDTKDLSPMHSKW